MTTGRRKLAELFGAWMDRNGYTQTDVASMGGPSTTTQSKVRNTDDSISRQTLRQLDAVMGWPNGTAGRIVQGEEGDPTATRQVDTPAPQLEIVRPTGQDEDPFVYARPDGLSDEEWRTAKIKAGGIIQWTIEQALQDPTTQ